MKKRASEDVKQFFPIYYLDQVKHSDMGYFPLFVSIFDHWLSGEEHNACMFTSYAWAGKMGARTEYLSGEEKFIAFYQRLARQGAYGQVASLPWDSKSGSFGDKQEFEHLEIETDDVEFLHLLKKGLREELPPHTSIIFYFPEFEMQACIESDRTDLLLLRNKDKLSIIQEIAEGNGLHLLNADHLDQIFD